MASPTLNPPAWRRVARAGLPLLVFAATTAVGLRSSSSGVYQYAAIGDAQSQPSRTPAEREAIVNEIVESREAAHPQPRRILMRVTTLADWTRDGVSGALTPLTHRTQRLRWSLDNDGGWELAVTVEGQPARAKLREVAANGMARRWLDDDLEAEHAVALRQGQYGAPMRELYPDAARVLLSEIESTVERLRSEHVQVQRELEDVRCGSAACLRATYTWTLPWETRHADEYQSVPIRWHEDNTFVRIVTFDPESLEVWTHTDRVNDTTIRDTAVLTRLDAQ